MTSMLMLRVATTRLKNYGEIGEAFCDGFGYSRDAYCGGLGQYYGTRTGWPVSVRIHDEHVLASLIGIV